jgi:hypothetical protein
VNKLKVLYDVVRTMRSKEAFDGTLTVEAHRGETQVFSLRNEFAKDFAAGRTRAKIATELDCEGKTVKHESVTEFAMAGGDGCRHHGFLRHMHQAHGCGCAGLKGKLAGLAFALSVLNALKTEEREDKTVAISLSAADLPEDARALLRERLNRAEGCHHHGPGLMKEFCGADDFDFSVEVLANKDSEVEKVVAAFVATRKDGPGAPRDLTARAELSLAW